MRRIVQALVIAAVTPWWTAVGEADLVTEATSAAIERGVAYLARTQGEDGAWEAGRQGYRCTLTALAGMALMANGNTPVSGPYAPQVSAAIACLLRCGGPDGLITSRGEEGRSMYGHGFAMLCLAQAYGMESNPIRQHEIARVLRAAIALTARSQSAAGGWLYTPDADGDEGSVTVTQIQGLRACRDAGLAVPSGTIERACAYIDKCASPDGGIGYSLRNPGGSRPPITAAAVATLYSGGRFDHPVAKRAFAFTLDLLQRHNMEVQRAYRGHTSYSLLYASQAVWFTTAEHWPAFYTANRDVLLTAQQADGSWKGDQAGLVYGTAMALLVLQLPYDYLPCFQR